jgi:hypothetical protein
MSLYKCRLVRVDHTPVGPGGLVSPLCNECETKDCSNPIELVKISIFGKTLDWKVYKKNNISIVVQCEGYSKSDKK